MIVPSLQNTNQPILFKASTTQVTNQLTDLSAEVRNLSTDAEMHVSKRLDLADAISIRNGKDAATGFNAI